MQQIAVVNAGSSTLKLSLFEGCIRRLSVLADRLDGPDSRVSIRNEDGAVCFDAVIAVDGHHGALAWLFDWLAAERPQIRLMAVGHRVVHGGDLLTESVLVTPAICEQIRALIPLAPLHQELNLDAIEFIARRFPELPQVACFDTAFHTTAGPMERMFALPRRYLEQGIRRYGFHGLSYEYISGRLHVMETDLAGGRSIVCHLGNGASLCAMKRGRSMATTMAFTALEGLPMGTRCGSIDPGVLLYLLEHEKMSAAELSDLLYRKSGLLGISGISQDMRDLLADNTPTAAEAVEYFCYRIAREIGSLAAVLGGLDTLVFTGGIGEHAQWVRARVCALSRWLGVDIDLSANTRHADVLSTWSSAVRVLIIPANEESVIAGHTVRIAMQ
ncbi:acetate/propionate family kinase [Candidatus Methylospira mobilis]|uniref:Acetate kinase n=1 Tax=Candidatus Methylospira mobilis TaxID=1808979 RepID=A0A5Q0BIU3_9GAMM|nr:acetate/propionate family kinase [Candidatus Methylospira mobilis]QFY42058.1 acetate/propionate family kinase [Candidatus Methylospira mobilis]